MELRLVTETLHLKFIQNLFTYAEGYEVRVSLYVLLKESYCLKAKLIEISQMQCNACMY